MPYKAENWHAVSYEQHVSPDHFKISVPESLRTQPGKS